jgi:hypothetical protein
MRIDRCARNAAFLIAVSSLPLAGQQNTGFLKTEVNPGRAGVFVDGKYIGPAGNFGISRKYSIASGEHEVRLLEPRYEEIVTKVTIQPGKTTKLAETMKALPPAKPPFGILRTTSPNKFAAVYVNGRFMGHAGEFNNSVQGLKLNPGDYKVKIVQPGAMDAPEEQVKIETDKVTMVHSK